MTTVRIKNVDQYGLDVGMEDLVQMFCDMSDDDQADFLHMVALKFKEFPAQCDYIGFKLTKDASEWLEKVNAAFGMREAA